MSSVKWFADARYGMFIHWGAYSVAARGEWVLNRERISKEEYTERYVKLWKTEKYDPATWVNLARDAGMKYLVLTTRHHDGFALWDSKVNDFNSARLGPCIDLVAPFAKAVRAAGLGLGFYYSPSSWTHPDYPGPFYRDWPGEADWKSEDHRKRFIDYYRAEIRELLTGYGKVDIFWLDGCIPGNLDGAQTLSMIKSLQPDILVNERLGEPYDFKNSEQAIVPAAAGMPWEACMTLNHNWGFHNGDNNFKSDKNVIEMLITCAAKAGNLLLNVGPRADGLIAMESSGILRRVGAWIARNSEFLYGSDRSEFGWNNSSKVTVKGNNVYLHFVSDPGPEFCWAELKNKVVAVRFLASGKPIRFRQENDRLFLESLPSPMPDSPVTTIVLQTEGEPRPVANTTTFWIPG